MGTIAGPVWVGFAEDVGELTVAELVLDFIELELLIDELDVVKILDVENLELVDVVDLEVDIDNFEESVEILLEEIVTDLEVDVDEVLRVETNSLLLLVLLLEDWLPDVPFLIYTLNRFPAPQYSY